MTNANESETPVTSSKTISGFGSTVEEHFEQSLDLNDLIVKHPTSTFFVKAEGDSMGDAGITDGDMLVVDRSLTPKDGNIVIAAINGELNVKKLQLKNHKATLLGNGESIPLSTELDTHFWGVVTHCVKRL